ncbi:alpha/beta hydrolase family protein [Janibacter terrae]|uniref:alpha/beta hydrolase family protein n=1 Tax=Janibacter terrae TaxID=103817 RepID=UPI003822CC36
MSTEDETLRRLQSDGGGAGRAATAYGPDPDQLVEVLAPATADPVPRTLVVVHGGYFRPGVDRAHARPMAAALASAGWRVALAEYRRVPGDPEATTADLAALDAHLRLAGHDVAAWVGHSAGGALVMWRVLQAHLPATRAVALAPVADFDAAVAEHLGSDAVLDWVGASPEEAPALYARLDPTRLRAADPVAAQRIRVLHGDADETVPLRQSQGWERTVLPGADHFDPVDPTSPHWPAVLDAVSG